MQDLLKLRKVRLGIWIRKYRSLIFLHNLKIRLYKISIVPENNCSFILLDHPAVFRCDRIAEAAKYLSVFGLLDILAVFFLLAFAFHRFSSWFRRLFCSCFFLLYYTLQVSCHYGFQTYIYIFSTSYAETFEKSANEFLTSLSQNGYKNVAPSTILQIYEGVDEKILKLLNQTAVFLSSAAS